MTNKKIVTTLELVVARRAVFNALSQPAEASGVGAQAIACVGEELLESNPDLWIRAQQPKDPAVLPSYLNELSKN
jgi:hypothetical protein